VDPEGKFWNVAIGAGIGAVGYLVFTPVFGGEYSWGGFLGAVGGGALAGATFGLFTPAYLYTGLAVSGAVGAGYTSVLQQAVDYGTINWNEVALSIGTGGILGGAVGPAWAALRGAATVVRDGVYSFRGVPAVEQQLERLAAITADDAGRTTTVTTPPKPVLCPSSLASDAEYLFTRASGWITRRFGGKNVYQNDALFDLKQMTSWKENGRTVFGDNLARMRTGRAPVGKDGKPVNLHHITQQPNGPMVELPGSKHSAFYEILHDNRGILPSLINRIVFGAERELYWIERARAFIP
jgi:filamentous hemagglutinin